MTSRSAGAAGSTADAGLGVLLAVALIGLGVLFVAGHLQAETLHEAAHDVRHAAGFPCH